MTRLTATEKASIARFLIVTTLFAVGVAVCFIVAAIRVSP
jgi:hypothetical protein